MNFSKTIIAVLCFLMACHPASRPLTKTSPLDNDEIPYTILVSLDGFRHDYIERYDAQHLKRIAAAGAMTSAMLPSFPSKTFPNHYTLVTGMYPSHHGIISNGFYDRVRNDEYRSNDPKKVNDGSWYGGMPLWVLAERQGIKTGCLYWVGSEAEIQGVRPTYYKPYQHSTSNEERINIAKEWLELPEKERPKMLFMYFPAVDDAGHDFGIESPQLERAVREMDVAMGNFYDYLQKSGLRFNLVIVSDHGMTAIEVEKPIFYESLTNTTDFRVGFTDTILMLYSDDTAKVQNAYRALKEKEKKLKDSFRVYLKVEVPDYLHFKNDARVGDLVVIPHPPYVLSKQFVGKPMPGTHGFDPYEHEDMQAVFLAAGTSFKSGKIIKPFENVHVYPLLAEIMRLKYKHLIDGKAEILKDIRQ